MELIVGRRVVEGRVVEGGSAGGYSKSASTCGGLWHLLGQEVAFLGANGAGQAGHVCVDKCTGRASPSHACLRIGGARLGGARVGWTFKARGSLQKERLQSSKRLSTLNSRLILFYVSTCLTSFTCRHSHSCETIWCQCSQL
jgi:hypothetical protein